jgi:DNA-binding NtrC family response regulator
MYIASASDQAQLRLVDLPMLAQGAHQGAWQFTEDATYRETRSNFEQEFEQRYVSWLLDQHDGNLSAAARAAKMDRKHLHELARRHGLRER